MIKEIKSKNYQILHVDFSIYDGRPLYIIGDFMDILKIEGVANPSNVLVRFNEGDFIPIDAATPANTPFYSLQLKNLEGNQGKITLLIGQEYFRVATQTISILRDLVGLAKTTDIQKIIDRLPSSLTAAGNLKVSLQETTIKQPIDVQDHWSESVVLLPSAARTASGSTDDIDVGRFLYAEICVDITAVSGTDPTLDVYIEGKNQYTGKYKILFSHTGLNAVQTIWDTIILLAFRYIRVRWVVGGSAPSFTFSVSAEMKS